MAYNYNVNTNNVESSDSQEYMNYINKTASGPAAFGGDNSFYKGED